jgi:hypothetical protein
MNTFKKTTSQRRFFIGIFLKLFIIVTIVMTIMFYILFSMKSVNELWELSSDDRQFMMEKIEDLKKPSIPKSDN